jgi:NAD(P)-dependent dehydrogenase (short-subunit alcohol dehydrogenase family)
MFDMSGKVAIVTGATQGLGAAIARELAERRAAGLVITGRNKERGEAVAARIAADTGTRTVFAQADLQDVESCRGVVAEADRAFGRVDSLVNSAGNTDRGTILDTSPELFDLIFAINVRAPFFLMQESVKLMRRDGIEGTIVSIGSMSALARNTAYALLRNRIRVNALNIGWMASDGEDRIQREFHGADPDWLDVAARRQPAGRLVDPREVARAVAFLASPESGLMTGSVIEYDQSVWGGYDSGPAPEAPL